MKVPELCKDCPKAAFFKENGCDFYWEEKSECFSQENSY